MTGPMQHEEIDAIVRQGELAERRKRRQFSLAKLLLWTAVAALILGLLRMLGAGPVVLASIGAWVVVNASVRSAFGSIVAFLFSIVAGGIALASLVLGLVWGGSFLSPLGILVLLLVAVGGGFLGYVSYVVLEVAFCIVGLPDGLLRSDRYDRQGPP